MDEPAMETIETIYDILGREIADGLIELFNDEFSAILEELGMISSNNRGDIKELTAEQEENLRDHQGYYLVGFYRTIGDAIVELVPYQYQGETHQDETHWHMRFIYPLSKKRDNAIHSLIRFFNEDLKRRAEDMILSRIREILNPDKLLDGIWDVRTENVMLLIEPADLKHDINNPEEPDFSEYYGEGEDEYWSIVAAVDFALTNVEELAPGGKEYEKAKGRYQTREKKYRK